MGLGPLCEIDTIDLQDPQAPSAQDHSRQPHRPDPLGTGLSPHQADALRHAEADSAEQQQRSPRVSWGNGDLQLEALAAEDGFGHADHDEPDDGRPDLDGATMVGSTRETSPTEDAEMADADDDDGLDDDMMDKISSSPSIDDGGYHLAPFSPADMVPSSSAPAFSSSLYPPSFTRLVSHSALLLHSSSLSFAPPRQEEGSRLERRHHHLLHHHQGGYLLDGSSDQLDDPADLKATCLRRLHRPPTPMPDPLIFDDLEDSPPLDNPLDGYEASTGFPGHDAFLLPRHDPLLNDSIQTTKTSSPWLSHLRHLSPLPPVRERADDDDDDDLLDEMNGGHDEFFFSYDSRFTDTGWGGQCLHDVEDINFDFVYALHGFPATVEGQANASKGDTMVLLDDRNSYWWLVRIVKDSTIGSLRCSLFSISPFNC